MDEIWWFIIILVGVRVLVNILDSGGSSDREDDDDDRLDNDADSDRSSPGYDSPREPCTCRECCPPVIPPWSSFSRESVRRSLDEDPVAVVRRAVEKETARLERLREAEASHQRDVAASVVRREVRRQEARIAEAKAVREEARNELDRRDRP